MALADSASIERTVAALASAGVETVVVNTRDAARGQLIEWVPQGVEVFVNTSETLATIGYTEFMEGNPGYVNLHDTMVALPDPAAQREFRRKTSVAEYFVGSVQAIAETGEIVIASSSGSQIAAYAYGARRVVLVAGTQKICPTLADAIARVRGYTLERHDQWLEQRGVAPTPIGKLMIMEREPVPGRVSMLLVRESLGW